MSASVKLASVKVGDQMGTRVTKCDTVHSLVTLAHYLNYSNLIKHLLFFDKTR